jgi:hypothetical protein
MDDIDAAAANLEAPAPVSATVLSSNVKDADQVLELKSTKEMAIAKVRVESETPTPTTLEIENNDGAPPPVKEEENSPAPIAAMVLSSNAKDADIDRDMKSTQAMENVDAKIKVESDTPTLELETVNNDDGGGGAPVKQEEKYDGDTEEEDDGPTTLSDLMEVLNEIDTPGSTCAAGPAKDLPPLPGLHIEGVGDIPLPISDVQAKLLADIAEQAPHGKGMETIVDTSVRNTLQVDPTKVTIQNPAWGPSLQKLVDQAAEALGVSPSLVRAELYKLLLYEPGGFFKKHRDTEKAKGMFATLVVQLPSKFTGGSFVVTHGGKSETFTMGAGEDAAYGCHFVCHYADCEHEIMKVESGHRLALVYSLCYTGSSCTPSAGSLGCDDLSGMLKRLPPSDSLFVIPLGHQYTTASLARLGAGALKGSDRAKQMAIESAGKGAWKTVIAKVERTDTESGSGGGGYYCGRNRYYEDEDDDDFDVDEVFKGDICLSDAYFADGSNASQEMESIMNDIKFESVEDGGMIMVSADEMGEDESEFWGEGQSGSVEYTGNEGATRETTYSTYILVVCSDEGSFDRKCANHFSSAVSDVLREGHLAPLHRLLAYINKKTPSITNNDCISLLKATNSIETSESGKLNAIKTIVYAMSRNTTELPSTLLTDTLIAYAEQVGWSSIMDPMKAYATNLQNRKHLSTNNFIACTSFILKIQSSSASYDFDTIMNGAIRKFESQEIQQLIHYRYGGYHGYASEHAIVSDALATLCRNYPREKTLSIAQACISRLRIYGGNDVDKLAEVVKLIEKLRSFYNSEVVEKWFRDVTEDFVAIVEKLPLASSSWTQKRSPPSDILSKNSFGLLFRHLFEFGESNDIKRVRQWATNVVQVEPLSKLDAILDRVASSPPAPTYRDASAIHEFVQEVKSRARELKLAGLYSRYLKLAPATQTANPVFSWSMPRATTSCQALTAFLRSPRIGPERIVVGGGIKYSRSLASGSNRYSASSNQRDQLNQGYSAVIEATSNTGKNAAIVVFKTRALFDAQMSKHTSDLAELSKLANEIRVLGGSVPLQNLAASATNGAVSNSISQRSTGFEPNPAKKPRMEIIEIE